MDVEDKRACHLMGEVSLIAVEKESLTEEG